MLLRFETENFLSFNEKVEFSLLAGDVRTKKNHIIEGKGIKILKTAVLYGANASGKSNLVRAIDFARNLIILGIDGVDTFNRHYRLSKENINRPTVFNFEIKAGEHYYSYGFGVVLAKNQIQEEWLYELSASGENLVFERTIDDKGVHQIELGLKLKGEAKRRFDVYKDDFKSSANLLFLSEINRKSLTNIHNQIFPLIDVYGWFENKLSVLFPDSKFGGLGVVGDNSQMAGIFDEFLHIFQTGVKKIVPKTENFDEIKIPDVVKQDIRKEMKDKLREDKAVILNINGESFALYKDSEGEFLIKKLGLKHESDEGQEVIFDTKDESDGTQRLLDLIPALHGLIKSDRVYVIDEVDRSLHSKLTYSLFELFLTLSAKCESQLIATTHEALLLDLDLLRKDEVWFVEKEKNASKLYSLDAFKVRNDKAIQKDYLLGRYGAIPLFKSFKHLKSCQED